MKNKIIIVVLASLLFFSFATSSHAITISGSETITTNSSASYSAVDCNGTVSWGVTGTGAGISSNGVLSTGSASCGGITVSAHCSDGSIATKTARVTNAGQWVTISLCDHQTDWVTCLSGDAGGCCQTSGGGGTCYNVIDGKYRYTTFWVRICKKPPPLNCSYSECGHSCTPSLPVSQCLVSTTDTCSGSPNNCYNQEVATRCFYNKVEEWQCPSCTNGQTISCYTGASETKGVGECKAGTQTCVNGQWGTCVGEVLPSTEICGNDKDENCDGNKDEGCNKDETTLGASCANIPFKSSAHPGSGNLFHDQTLFQTTTLNFTLSYNSIDIYSGSLGKSWTHNWNILLFSSPDNSIGLKQGDGNVIYFKLSNGVYYPEANSGDTSYIAVNNDNTFTRTLKDGTNYNFNTSGKLTSIKDRNGNTTTLAYNGDTLTTITDPSGRTIYITTGNGKITSITTPDNKVYRLAYSGDSLVSVADPDLNTWQYTYNQNSQMLTKTDPQGYVTTYTYDANNKVISSTDPEGKTKAITYDPINQTAQAIEKDGGVWTYKYDPLLNVTTQKTDPLGNITTYTYDTNKNLISTKEPDGSTTTYTYDAYGNMASVTDPLGNTTSYTYNTLGQVTNITDAQNKVTTYAYDQKGNLISTTDPTGAITQYQYDSNGNITSITNASGQTTSFTYDQYNNLSSVTDSTGATTTFTYDIAGNILSQTDPNGSTTTYQYNNLNQLIKITDPQGSIATYTYDKAGNKISETDANGKTTNYEYNYRNQITKVTDSLGNITTYTYGGTGCSSCGGGGDKLTSITDPNGRVTGYLYDSIGRLIKITDPTNGIISYTYDSRGRLTSVTDSNGNVTTYEYDSVGRVVKTSSADTGITTYTYNSVGNVLTKTDANGITAQYTYDSLNRLTNIQFPDQTENITYTYDNCTNGKGRLCSMTDPSGTTGYEYDSLGRLTREIKTIIGINYTTTYEYDKTGSLTTITYPSKRKVSYTYNSVYRPTSVSQQLNHGKTSLASNILYDKTANMLSMTLGNKITQQWTYDAKNRIHTITVPAVFALNYTYDPVGNITYIIDQYNPANIKTYTYDSIDRLTNAAGPWGNLAWTYDANGNRLTQNNNKNKTYTYEANHLTSVTTNNHVKTYQYDNNGNTLSNGKLNFIYNQNNRLMKAVADGKVIGEYTYNGKGQRIIKKTKSGDSDDEGEGDDGEYDHHIIFHYDLAGKLIEETKANGKLIVDYIYLNGSPLAMIRKQHHQEETFYYHNDHLGTPKVMTDKLKKIVWNIEFDPFGNEIKHNHGRHGQYIRKVKNNLRFTGQYSDKETGLHQNYFRDYDPESGTYRQSDPIGLLGGMNTYSYGNNPVNTIDPYGLTETTWTLTLPRILLPALPVIAPALIPLIPPAIIIGGILYPSSIAEEPAIPQSIDKPKECDDNKPCPPCNPPVGTIGYVIHYDHPHNHMQPHVHYWQRNQNPTTCECFWNDLNGRETSLPPRPGSIPMPPEYWTRRK